MDNKVATFRRLQHIKEAPALDKDFAYKKLTYHYQIISKSLNITTHYLRRRQILHKNIFISTLKIKFHQKETGKKKRDLEARVKEHFRNIKNREIEKSAVAAHVWKEKHDTYRIPVLLKQASNNQTRI